MGNRKIDIATCSKIELDLLFARLKSNFADNNPIHVLDCQRVYLPIANVSEHYMKDKSILAPLKTFKKWTGTILERFNFHL